MKGTTDKQRVERIIVSAWKKKGETGSVIGETSEITYTRGHVTRGNNDSSIGDPVYAPALPF